jgi:hypothetical protein
MHVLLRLPPQFRSMPRVAAVLLYTEQLPANLCHTMERNCTALPGLPGCS